MVDVASRLCGMHAQLMSSAELSLWARVAALTPDRVRDALWKERTLVKTWAMRGTLHLLPASEWPLWRAALGSYDHYLKTSWGRYFGVSVRDVETLIEAVGAALDGRQLTREELADEVARNAGSRALGDKLRESWGSFLKPCAYRGRAVFRAERWPEGSLHGTRPLAPDGT
jgi:hypothetical protein